jgi:iron complex outermembrane receptor protein
MTDAFHNRPKVLQASTLLLSFFAANSAIQAEPVNEAAAKETSVKNEPRSRLLEEIIVTAQKREEDIRDVPISIQAFSGGMLEARGIESNIDLPKITPG